MKGKQLASTVGMLAIAYLVFGIISGLIYTNLVPGDAASLFTSYIPLLLVMTLLFLLVSLLMLRFLPRIAWLTPVILSLLGFASLYFAFPDGLTSAATMELVGTIVTVLLAPGLLAFISVSVVQRLYLRRQA